MPLLHIVCVNFNPELTEERIVDHFEREVALRRRMPELVLEWSFHKNISLESRADVNGGCQWVVMVKLLSPDLLDAYLVHPQHKEIGEIQSPMLRGKFVVDIVV